MRKVGSKIMIRKNSVYRIIFGVLAACAALICIFSISGSLVKSGILSVGFVVIGCFQIKIPKSFRFLVIVLVLLFSAALALFLSQFSQNEGFASLKEGMLLRGYLCCLVLAGLLYLVFGEIRSTLIGTVGIPLVLATLNWFIYRYRGSEFIPIDILSFGTAMNVAAQYDFTFTPNLVYAWVIFLLVSAGIFSVSMPRSGRKNGEYLSVLVLEFLFCILFAVSAKGNVAIHFGNGGTYYHGYILNFVLSAKELFVEKPAGYSQESVRLIMEDYLNNPADSAGDNMPNIIVIMDEAYADLSVLGDNFNTSTEVSPFVKSLEENTVKGYAMTSAYGGRTANSEFEFLTGATMGFVPKGTVAYQRYIRTEKVSLATVLKERGYDTVAMHPYLKNGWTRNTAWPNLGFEECYFLEDFPQENLMRGLVSDQEMMEYVLARFERQDPDIPLFLFGVTMQNHSSYDYEGSDFQTVDFLTGYSQQYPAADQYLTLVHESDKAAKYLIEYLEASDRDTIVVWFGDHLPALDSSLYEEIHGGAFDSLDEQKRHYMVPFFIWSNYGIIEQEIDCTSLSFLSALVFRSAGMELTPYQQFLSDVEEAIPSINMEGYYSKEQQEYIPIGGAAELEYDWLNRYQQIQYNYLFEEADLAFYGVG